MILIAALAALAALPLAAVEETAALEKMTVETAVALALENNLGLNRTRIETAGKKREADRVWNSLIPSVSAGAQVSRGVSLTGDTGAGQEDWTPQATLQAQLTLSPALVSAARQVRADYEAGVLSYEEAKRELELQVRKLYCQLLLLRANVELAEQTVKSAEERYQETAALTAAGRAARLEELSARVDWENQKPALRSAQTQYANALETFALTLGMENGEGITLAGTLVPGGAAYAGLPDATRTMPANESIEKAQNIAWNSPP